VNDTLPLALRLYTEGDSSVGIGGDEITIFLPDWFRDGIDATDGPGTVSPRAQFEADAVALASAYLDGKVHTDWSDIP